MRKILVIGEVLVEIMADTPGDGFVGPQALTGPFPSGAPAIFCDQAAHLGQPVALVSAVGDDDFGRLNVDRLRRDGVDVSGIAIDPDRPTGSAFVRYRTDGSRDFVFNIKHSACGQLNGGEVVANLIAQADHIHIMGTSLSSEEFVALNLHAAQTIRARRGTVSFDPNFRKEIALTPFMAKSLRQLIAMTDVYLPSGEELTFLVERDTAPAAIAELLNMGVGAVVHKKGSDGASYHDLTTNDTVDAFPVSEVDPTGAGDCFGATFVALWLRGTPPATALRLAAASGAIAVTKRGPMEGVATLQTLQAVSDGLPVSEIGKLNIPPRTPR